MSHNCDELHMHVERCWQAGFEAGCQAAIEAQEEFDADL